MTQNNLTAPDPYDFDTDEPTDEEFFNFLASNDVTREHEPQDITAAMRGKHLAYNIWSFDDLGHDLTIEEQLFVRSYMIDRNEVASLRRLGYVNETPAQLRRIAHRFLRSVHVQDAIRSQAEKLMKKLDITAEHVNEKIAHIAFTDIHDIAVFDGVAFQMLPSQLWPAHARTAVKSVKNGQFGLNVEFYDKQKSLDFLAKQTGLDTTEKDKALAQAEVAAQMAIGKIVDVVARVHELKQAKVVEDKRVG